MSGFAIGETVGFGDGKTGVIEGFFESATIRDSSGKWHSSPVDELIKIVSLKEGDRVRAYCQEGVIVSGPFRSPQDEDRYVILLDDGSHVLCSVNAIKKI